MTLQEMLQKRAELFGKMRQMLDNAKTAGRDLTEQEEKDYDAIDAQIKALDKNIDREKALADREKDLDLPVEKKFRPAAVGGAPVQDAKEDDGGFKSFGEFVHAIRYGDKSGRLDERSYERLHGAKDMTMGTNTSGGYLVPPVYSRDILKLSPESSIVRPRATVIPAGDVEPDAQYNIPELDQTGTNGVFGGVTVTWIAEGASKPPTQPIFKEISLQPQEVAASVTVTDKLLRNWKAADPFVSTLLRQAMAAAEDIAFLSGNGTGKPTGINNAANTGQLKVTRVTANKISYEDVVAMMAKALPNTMGDIDNGFTWVASQSILPQLLALQNPAGYYIFIAGDATKGIPASLMGYPIRFTGKTAALGAKGDLMFIDFSKYLIKDGSGPFVGASPHPLWVQNKTIIKCFWNVDGKPWVTGPLTLEDGATVVSPFIILDSNPPTV